MVIEETLQLLSHKFKIFSQRLSFVLIPWVSFWSQDASQLQDQVHTHVAIAKEGTPCKSASRFFSVSIARSQQGKNKGLSGRLTPLTRREGMLFVFDPPQHASFWMKNTHIPLQLAFFDAQGRLVELHNMAVERDPSHPTRLFQSSKAVSTALEVPPSTIPTSAIDEGYILCIEK